MVKKTNKKICLQCRKPGFDPWVRKISWRREWQPTPVFLPGEFLRQRSLIGYSPWDCKESDTTERLHSLPNINICLELRNKLCLPLGRGIVQRGSEGGSREEERC